MEKDEKHAKIFFVSVAQNMLHVRAGVSDVVLERGAWSVERGAWSVERGAWSVERVRVWLCYQSMAPWLCYQKYGTLAVLSKVWHPGYAIKSIASLAVLSKVWHPGCAIKSMAPWLCYTFDSKSGCPFCYAFDTILLCFRYYFAMLSILFCYAFDTVLLCFLLWIAMHFAVNNMLIEATLLIVVFGKIGRRTIKKE